MKGPDIKPKLPAYRRITIVPTWGPKGLPRSDTWPYNDETESALSFQHDLWYDSSGLLILIFYLSVHRSSTSLPIDSCLGLQIGSSILSPGESNTSDPRCIWLGTYALQADVWLNEQWNKKKQRLYFCDSLIFDIYAIICTDISSQPSQPTTIRRLVMLSVSNPGGSRSVLVCQAWILSPLNTQTPYITSYI